MLGVFSWPEIADSNPWPHLNQHEPRHSRRQPWLAAALESRDPHHTCNTKHPAYTHQHVFVIIWQCLKLHLKMELP